jgi:hypothetical protein
MTLEYLLYRLAAQCTFMFFAGSVFFNLRRPVEHEPYYWPVVIASGLAFGFCASRARRLRVKEQP